jgi:plasmid stability protein
MPTLYVENVPKELYQALRKRARDSRKSIAAEVISLLERNVPTGEELRRRREFYDRMAETRGAQQPARSGAFPTAEEMIREDRDR